MPHNPRFRRRQRWRRSNLNRRQHNGDIHDFVFVLLPAVAAGDPGQGFEGNVPVALAELDVFKVEFAERVVVLEDEVGDLVRVHDGVFELHDAQAGEGEGARTVGEGAEGGVLGALVLGGEHAGLEVEG